MRTNGKSSSPQKQRQRTQPFLAWRVVWRTCSAFNGMDFVAFMTRDSVIFLPKFDKTWTHDSKRLPSKRGEMALMRPKAALKRNTSRSNTHISQIRDIASRLGKQVKIVRNHMPKKKLESMPIEEKCLDTSGRYSASSKSNTAFVTFISASSFIKKGLSAGELIKWEKQTKAEYVSMFKSSIPATKDIPDRYPTSGR